MPDNKSLAGGGSSLFSGFRVLGLYSNHVPHAVRYHQKHREFYLVTAVGKSFHTYNVNRLGIVAVSNSLLEDISYLAADRMLVFVAAGKLISAFARNKEVVMRYQEHKHEVRLLLPLGDHLVSADSGGDVIVWDVQGGDIYLRLEFNPASFDVSAMMHPSTYLNKVLFGSSQGALQLWNIKTSKLLFTFPGWSAGVTVLQQSPAVDVVGVGTATGRIIIHNIRLDETLMSFTQDWGPVTSLAFRTGTGGSPPLSLTHAHAHTHTHTRILGVSFFVRRSSDCGVRQPSGSHCFLGSGAPSDCHTAETRPQHRRCRGNLSARRAAADHHRSRQRHQGKATTCNVLLHQETLHITAAFPINTHFYSHGYVEMLLLIFLFLIYLRLSDSRYGYLTRKGAGPDYLEVGRATAPLPPPSVTMATMEKTSSVQVRTGRCSPSPPSTSVSTRTWVTVGVSQDQSAWFGAELLLPRVSNQTVFSGSGSINKKKEKKKKKGLSYEELRLPAITAFTSATARQSDWDGIAACHRGRRAATTWNYQRCTMGAHQLQPPAVCRDAVATAVDVTSCGNFAVIGSSSGRVDVYNMQSGLHRGCYGDDGTAHSGAVRGVAVDALNQLTFTSGSDWLLKFWCFKSKKQEEQLQLGAAAAGMKLHRESGMLALALDDFTVLVVDTETRRVVRKFAGHRGNVNDMTFSPDGRWLVTVAMDCTIRTWDLPSGSLVDCFLVAMAPVSVSMSPTGDFLATAHVDSLGVYLWTNKSLCGPVGLRPLPADYQPTETTLPGVTAEEPEQEVTSEDVDDAYQSAEQLGAELVTLSLLPESRWKSLLHLDVIKRRNKPVAPPAAPAAAPFFLPTLAGLTPRFAALSEAEGENQSKVVSLGSLAERSEFASALEASLQSGSFDLPLRLLKDSGPSAISMELTNLAPEGGGASSLLLAFIQMIDSMLASGRDFDLAHGYLALFLKFTNFSAFFQLHLRLLSQDAVAMEALLRLSSRLEDGWAGLRASFDQSLCLLSYAKSALL
ncbi:unnamed protein product, partial [Tetraodon nigroviridis]